MVSDGQDNGAEKPSNIKVADDKFLKNNEIDAHQIKKDFLGSKAEIKLYDIYVDKDSGQLWIFRKGGNYLSNQQRSDRDKEFDACKGSVSCQLQVGTKWDVISLGQDTAYSAGMLTGVPQGLYDSVESLSKSISDPAAAYDAIKQLIASDDIFSTMSDAVKQSYIDRINLMESEYQKAGASGAYNAGVEAGKLVSDLIGAIAGGVGVAKVGKSKNSLDTGTLGFSDIENKADFKAEHQGGSLSTGGPVGSDLLSNLGGVVLSWLGNDGHAAGTTQAAVSDGTIIIRDSDKQQQNVDDLSRDTDNANGSIGPIFDKEKEQNRLKEAQLIGGQAMDIARTQGDILGLDAALKANPTLKGDAEALRETKEYKAEMQKYGTGSALQQGLQAATAAIQGLAGGNMAQALAGASAPYLAEVIHNMTTDPVTGKVNTEANLMAHAVLGAVVAQVNGNSALAGASGAAMGEYIAQQMYPGIKREDLTEEQRQTISALGTLAAGLAGGLTGDSTADAVAGAQAGKNAVENNYLSVSEKTEFEIAKQKLNSNDPAEREKAQQTINALREKDIASDQKVIEACGNGAAASAACGAARLEVIAAKGEYETGPYNSKVSQQYADAYGQIVNLLNVTSVDAQNQ
ncbi:VENN motif pre-toxin domain-containing protein [Yersinia enterocolitica]|uniref:VENN motif pre-toxin domain-containing protein n=1 Tax=Yersinia enterocolitica TaxID=630 RepID=UPI003D093EFD